MPTPGARGDARRSRSWWRWLAIVLALGWPVEGLAQRFQWGHVLPHMLLIAVAAPLLVLSEPWLRPLHAMPRRWRGPTGRVLFR